MSGHTLHLGDCLEVMRTMADCSVDAVVTDPPYGLSFMGKAWDYDVPGVDVWREVLRLLKPGGHLLAFAGTRTQHRMAVAIEDAGFEIRDMIAWVYGSGFPKSLDVSKAIDKCNGESGRALKFTRWMRQTGLQTVEVRNLLYYAGLITEKSNQASHYFAATINSQPTVPTAAMWAVIRPHCGEVPAWVDELVQRIEAEREVVGQKTAGIANPDDRDRHTVGGSAAVVLDITAPATPEAQQWEGWGTALKPALEPITMARKPFKGTVAANVLEHGTGAINVDGCRVGTSKSVPASVSKKAPANCYGKYAEAGETPGVGGHDPNLGRWPANLIHDGSGEVVGLFPETGISSGGTGTASKKKDDRHGWGPSNTGGKGDSGSAARFFYTAKATKAERQGVTHPTVKPLDLMAYLCRLVTPPGGTVLDPFMGSGTTIKAALSEGFNAIGIERDPAYFAMAEHRMNGTQLGLGLDL